MKLTQKFLTALAPAMAFSACQNERTENQKPNIIYILADDLGYGDLGCYGQEIIKTPNIDKLAENGLRFTQHYAGCTVSAPSRCSLLTGLHTGHSFIRGNREIQPEGQEALPAGTTTFPRLLQQAGYTTGCFGKWGLGFPGSEGVPEKQGFDEFFGYNCQRLSHRYYPYHLWHNSEKVILEGNEDGVEKPSVYAQDLIQEKALEFIRQNKEKSFFMFVSSLLPHAELISPQDSIWEMYAGKIEEGVPYHGVDTGKMVRWSHYGSCEMPHASFASMVTRLDAYVGQIMAELKKQGLEKNTLVIFASDNGPHQEGGADPDFFKSYGKLRGLKRDVFEGGIRVPMIAYWQGKILPGTSDLISAFWDMMPTFAELAGAEMPANLDGVSLVPTLLGKGEQKQHEFLYWEFHELGGRQAVRKGDWKIIRQPIADEAKTKVSLYNLRDDLHEDNDVSAQVPDVAAELEKLLDSERTESELFNFGR